MRQHNIYIMEAVDDLNLTTPQLEQINTCRMYLQVTTLAEITDHTGMHLLPQILTPHGHTYPNGLDNISCSTLQWPRVSNPTPTKWKVWTRTICTLFTGSAMGTKLNIPLGTWTQDYNTNRFWKWHLATPE